MLLLLDNAMPWLGDLLDLGGGILLAIIVVAVLMWLLIIERLLYYRLAYPPLRARACDCWRDRSERNSWYARQFRRHLVVQIRRALNQNLALIRTLVLICPLLGLLGTVLGMLDVFDAVAATGENNPRSTAAGVSKATVSTMAGMVVALSGILISTYLERRASEERSAFAERLSNMVDLARGAGAR